MAVNESRNLNDELSQGLTDGLVRKLTPDRGGSTEDHNSADTARLHQMYVPYVREWEPTSWHQGMDDQVQAAIARMRGLGEPSPRAV